MSGKWLVKRWIPGMSELRPWLAACLTLSSWDLSLEISLSASATELICPADPFCTCVTEGEGSAKSEGKRAKEKGWSWWRKEDRWVSSRTECFDQVLLCLWLWFLFDINKQVKVGHPFLEPKSSLISDSPIKGYQIRLNVFWRYHWFVPGKGHV